MTAIPEDQWVAISALQHYQFCPRQAALIHVEGLWIENRATAEGRVMHDRAHESGAERRGPVVIERGLHLYSPRYGLTGVADVIEIHYATDRKLDIEKIVPIEYKRGRPKTHNADKIQLCAEAMCLEDMFRVSVTQGYLFYGRTRRRTEVDLSDVLRKETLDAVNGCRQLLATRCTPRPVSDARCEQCSFVDVCLPYVQKKHANVRNFVERALSG